MLRSLEPVCERLSLLVKLDLKNVSLERIPAALALCAPSLTHLDVSDNPSLVSLDGIQALSKLRVLFAAGCHLGPELPAGGLVDVCVREREYRGPSPLMFV